MAKNSKKLLDLAIYVVAFFAAAIGLHFLSDEAYKALVLGHLIYLFWKTPF